MKLYQRIFIAFFDIIRSFLGLKGMVCIYPLSCSDYAKILLQTKPLYKSVPLTLLRLLSCNPATAVFFCLKQSLKTGS